MINEIQRFIGRLAESGNLSRDESSRAFQIVMSGGATPAQIAALLMGLRMKGETVEEITGAAITMRAKMETITVPLGTIDVCGTGGDAKNTFNVSTAVALVVAAAGVPVAKHGNKSVSSRSGSADVLSALGVQIQVDRACLEACLEQAKLCFMYAPLYHKAMRHASPVRQELGIRTLFNLLGPLCNPAKPARQLMGVFEKALLMPMAEVLKQLGCEAAWVVHGEDGMDELTLTGPTHVAALENQEIRLFEVTPEEAGLARVAPESLQGGSPHGNARELALLLAGKQSAYRDIVLLNAAAALKIAGKVETLTEGAAMAAKAIDEGRAKETLASLIHLTNLKEAGA